MKTTTLRTAVSFVDGDESLEQFLRALGRAMDATIQPKSPVSKYLIPTGDRLEIPKNSFTILEDVLVVKSLPPVRVLRPELPQNHEMKHLVLALALPIVRAEILSRRKRRPKSLAPGNKRIHNPAAIFITKQVRPRSVGGGLPSLGKSSK